MIDLTKISDRHLLAAYRVAKTRLRPFFGPAKAMKALRDELIRRELLADPQPVRVTPCKYEGK